MDQQSLTAQQFGNTARNYLTSAVHAQGADLARLARLVQELGAVRALDLGCGAGHASFALAGAGAAKVVAYDLAGDMLSVVADEAQARGYANLVTARGSAESLAFDDASFDLVVTRLSAHHWLRVEAAMAEVARVLKPTGTLVVIDVLGAEVPVCDTALQTVELLRDASHVRDYRLPEWRAMLERAGFVVTDTDSWTLPIEFESWVKRIGTSAPRIAALRTVMAELPQEAKDYLALQADGSFSLHCGWISARHR